MKNENTKMLKRIKKYFLVKKYKLYQDKKIGMMTMILMSVMQKSKHVCVAKKN